MKRVILIAAALAALFAAGTATAFGLHTVWISPGHCKVVSRQKVCARRAAAKTVRSVTTVTVTVPAPPPPPPTTLTWSGAGSQNIGPFTLASASTITWQGSFVAGVQVSGPTETYFLSGNSGSSYLPAGQYAGIQVFGQDWTITIKSN